MNAVTYEDICNLEWLNDYIEQVIYINLDSRSDRRMSVEKQLEDVFFEDKIQRFSAIQHKFGCIGCSKSHKAVLAMAMQNNWKNYLVVEDDFVWTNFKEGLSNFKKLVTAQPNFDVICFASAHSILTETQRLLSGQTTTAQLVSCTYQKTLFGNFEKGVSLLEDAYSKKLRNKNIFCIDQYWKELQQRHKWYLIQPQICTQSVSYSNIENDVVDYREAFQSLQIIK